MIGIRFLRKNSVILDKSLEEHVGKHLWFPDFVGDGIKLRLNRIAPDMLKDVEFFEIRKPRYNGESLDGKHIVFLRSGGAGDLLMIAPTINKLKKLYPTCEVTLITGPAYVDVAKMIPSVDHVGVYPVFADMYKHFDYWATFERSIEAPIHIARTMHGVDLFASLTPVELDDDEKVSSIDIPTASQEAMDDMLGDIVPEGGKIIALQFRCTNINRAFDQQKMVEVIARLSEDENNYIFVLGGEHTIRDDNNKPKLVKDCPIDFFIKEGIAHPRIHNFCGELRWHESAALINRSHLVVGPDSIALHMAGSLGKPMVGIFGPFPPELRLAYYDNATWVKSKKKCAPCFAHGSSPCSKFKKDAIAAPCWESINPIEVVNMCLRQLEEENES